jgi:hypothetical protein
VDFDGNYYVQTIICTNKWVEKIWYDKFTNKEVENFLNILQPRIIKIIGQWPTFDKNYGTDIQKARLKYLETNNLKIPPEKGVYVGCNSIPND